MEEKEREKQGFRNRINFMVGITFLILFYYGEYVGFAMSSISIK